MQCLRWECWRHVGGHTHFHGTIYSACIFLVFEFNAWGGVKYWNAKDMLQLVFIHIKALLDERHISMFFFCSILGFWRQLNSLGWQGSRWLCTFLIPFLFIVFSWGGRLRGDASCSGSELQVCHYHHHHCHYYAPQPPWCMYLITSSSVHNFASSSIHQFISSSVHPFIRSSVHQFISSSVADISVFFLKSLLYHVWYISNAFLIFQNNISGIP